MKASVFGANTCRYITRHSKTWQSVLQVTKIPTRDRTLTDPELSLTFEKKTTTATDFIFGTNTCRYIADTLKQDKQFYKLQKYLQGTEL